MSRLVDKLIAEHEVQTKSNLKKTVSKIKVETKSNPKVILLKQRNKKTNFNKKNNTLFVHPDDVGKKEKLKKVLTIKK